MLEVAQEAFFATLDGLEHLACLSVPTTTQQALERGNMWYVEIYYSSGHEELAFYPTREQARMRQRAVNDVMGPHSYATSPRKAD